MYAFSQLLWIFLMGYGIASNRNEVVRAHMAEYKNL